VAADLALEVPAKTPPDLLLARIRRSIRDGRAVRRRGSFVATAAGVAALVGMAALSMSLGTRATRAETHLDKMGSLFDALSQPGASPVRLEALDATPMVEVSGQTPERMIVAGRGIPRPAPGHVYVIWIGTETALRPLGSVTPDEDGFVYRTFEVDLSSFDRILITEERAGSRPQTPRPDSPHTWRATL
jgi:hypothetical protein